MSAAERSQLESWTRRRTSAQALALRSRIVLLAAERCINTEIAQRATHDYKRSGTSSLYAALDITTGRVIGALHSRHRAIEFKKFLQSIDREVSDELAVHLVLDNSSTHRTPAIRTWPIASELTNHDTTALRTSERIVGRARLAARRRCRARPARGPQCNGNGSELGLELLRTGLSVRAASMFAGVTRSTLCDRSRRAG